MGGQYEHGKLKTSCFRLCTGNSGKSLLCVCISAPFE